MGAAKRALPGLLLVVEGLGALALALGGLVVNGLWVNEGQVNVDTYPWWSAAGKTFAAWLAPIAIFSVLANSRARRKGRHRGVAIREPAVAGTRSSPRASPERLVFRNAEDHALLISTFREARLLDKNRA